MGSIHFDAGIGMDNWRRNIREIRNDITNLNRDTQNSAKNMNATFKNLSTAIAGYFSVNMLQSFIMKVIEVRGEFQKTEIALKTMLKSSTKASQLLAEMTDLAEKTPFSFREVADGAKQLLAFQVPANQVIDTLRRMGDIASGLGVPLSRIQLVYGQVKAKGRLMGDDLRQFTEAGIPMVAELAKKFNLTTAEVSAMVSAGKVGFKDVKDVLFSMTNEGGLFFNLMEKQSKSLSGRISNLGDVFEQMLNKIGQANEGILNNSIDAMAYLVENYEKVIKAIVTIVEVYGLYKGALMATIAIQKASMMWEQVRVWIALAKSIRNTADAQALLNLTLGANPYAKIIMVIGALLVVMYNYRQEIGEVLGFVDKLSEAQKYGEAVTKKYNDNFASGVVDTKSAIQSLIYVIKNEYSTLEQRKVAYEKLIGINVTFKNTLDENYRATVRLGEAFDGMVGRVTRLAMAQAEAAVKMEAYKKVAETEMNLGINEVKFDEAKHKLKELRKLYDQGKLTQQQFFDAIDKTGASELQKEIRAQTATLKEQRKEKEYIEKLDKRQLDNLQKGIAIQTAQIKGGKRSGKIMTDKEKELLQADLNNNKEILNVKLGIEIDVPEEEVTKALGEYGRIQEKIEKLQASLPYLSVKEAHKAQAEIDRLNELLKPKKPREDRRQMAEIFPEDSVKDLQRRVQLWTDSIESASDGMVKLRKLDKYGNDKDKKGNPYFTGEVVSVSDAVARRLADMEKLADKEFQISARSTKEILEDAERQWQNYYNVSNIYGKEMADEQFKSLRATGLSYSDFLGNMYNELYDKFNKGLVTEADKENLTWLENKMNTLGGVKTPFENFRINLEDGLAKLPLFTDQITFLEGEIEKAGAKFGVGSTPYSQMFILTQEKKEEALQGQKDLINRFLVENESFERKKLTIATQYEDMRKRLQATYKGSEGSEEYLRLYAEMGRQEAKAYQSAFASVFEKSDVYEKAFGNIDALTKRDISQLIPAIQSTMEQLIDMGAPTEEIEKFRQKIEDLKSLTTSNSPIKKLIDNFKELRKKIKEGTATEADFQRLQQSIQEVEKYTKMATEAAKEMAEALGIGDKGGPYEKFAKDLTQTIEGLVNAIVGYFSGNMEQMVSGIIQMVVGVVKMLSTAGDGRKESQIRKWKLAVDELKQSYEELQRVIESTAGEAQLTMQKELIANLREQQKLLIQMRDKESSKKKADQDKIANYGKQINEINVQIQQVVDDFKKSVTTTDFKSLSEKISTALIEAFGKGEDAVKAFDKIVDEVMRNAVANALRIKILEPVVNDMVNQIYNSMGYGNASTSAIDAQIKDAEEQIKLLEEQMKNKNLTFFEKANMEAQRDALLNLIKDYKHQISQLQASGNFDGLSPEEREQIKKMGEKAMQDYMNALQQYEDLFGSASENANSLKGDIKGITEKTAGILEAQINSMRINQVEMLKLQRLQYQIDQKALSLLTDIEINTRPILWIYEKLKKVIP